MNDSSGMDASEKDLSSRMPAEDPAILPLPFLAPIREKIKDLLYPAGMPSSLAPTVVTGTGRPFLIREITPVNRTGHITRKIWIPAKDVCVRMRGTLRAFHPPGAEENPVFSGKVLGHPGDRMPVRLIIHETSSITSHLSVPATGYGYPG